MNRAWIGIVSLATVLAAAPPASAQEKGQVGLVMGYPAAIGVQWHASNTVAIRPEVTVSTIRGTNSYTGAFTDAESDTTGYAFGVGFKALFYLAKWDSLSAFVAPGFTYGRSTSTTSHSDGDSTATSNVYHLVGSFGAQYALSKRFSVLGEVGLQYSRQDSDSATTGGAGGSSASTSNFGTRAAVGVAFYFK